MDEIASAEILDMDVFNQLKQLFGDNFDFGVDQFKTNALKNITNIEQAIEQSDVELLERSAHSLKGASGQFGASYLSSLASEMEVFGREGDVDKARENIARLRDAYEQISALMAAS